LQQQEQDTTIVSPIRKDEWVGRTLAGKYEVVEMLGKGGMSAVYKVKHVILGKPYAVKMLHPHMVANGTALERFRTEASAAAKLTHPNIITIHDYDDEEGHPFQAIDYLEGVSLADEIRKCGRLEPVRALNVFVQACSALAHAHEMNVIHRDLKPSNIMLIEKDGVKDVVKLVDFGIAKVMPQEGEAVQQLTQTGEIFGTPLYMSPEQCLGQKLDTRSDIYSFGCLMYETLVGRPPLAGSTVFATIQKHVDETPKSIKEELNDSSSRLIASLDAIIAKTLAKQPSQRQQSMHELLDELTEAKRGARAGVVTLLMREMQVLWIRLEPLRKRTPMHLVVPLFITMSLLFVATSFIWQSQTVTIKHYEAQAWPQFSPEAMVWGTFGQNNETLALASLSYSQLRKRVVDSINAADPETAARYEMSLVAPFAKNGNYAQAASEAKSLKEQFDQLERRKPDFDPYELMPKGASRPDVAQELMFIGDACYQARDWPLAEYFFEKAVDELAGEGQHLNKRINMKIGDCKFQQHDFEGADQYFHRAAGVATEAYAPKIFDITDDAYSEDRAAWMGKVGDISIAKGYLEQALQAYRAATVEWNKSPNPRGFIGQSYFLLGQTQEKMGLLQDARKSFQKACERSFKQNIPAAWAELAKVELAQGAYADSLMAQKSAVDAAHGR
jgi:serine/threonine protein kinase